MPVNSINADSVPAGTLLVPANPRRVALQVFVVAGWPSFIFVGDSEAECIVIPLIRGQGYPLLLNVHGTAIQGNVYSGPNLIATSVIVTETWRLPDGTT